jgi:hypothetical protein
MTAKRVAMSMNAGRYVSIHQSWVSMGCSPSFRPNDRTSHTLPPILHAIADELSETNATLAAITFARKSDIVVVCNDFLSHGKLNRW